MTGSPVKRKRHTTSSFEKIETSVSKKRKVVEAKDQGVTAPRQASAAKIIAPTSNKIVKPASCSTTKRKVDKAIKDSTESTSKKRKTDGIKAGIGGKSAGLVQGILVSNKTKTSTSAKTETKSTKPTAEIHASRVLRSGGPLRVRVRDDLYVEKKKIKDRKKEENKSRK